MNLGTTISKTATIGHLEISVESGKIAKQANSAILRCGDLVLFASAVAESSPKPDLDFFPLLIDYREKYFAAGKIPGGYQKREGRPSDHEIITARTIDRPIRPLFPEGFKNETSINIVLLSSPNDLEADVFAMNVASCALGISEIPFGGPVGCVRVGKIDGKLVLFPTVEQLKTSKLNLIVAGTASAVTMVESIAYELSEEEMLEAIAFGHQHVKELVALQNELIAAIGKPKIAFEYKQNKALFEALQGGYKAALQAALQTVIKQDRAAAVKAVKTQAKEDLITKGLANSEEQFKADFSEQWEKFQEVIMRDMILQGKRVDGRKTTEIRPILVDVKFLPHVHGSAVFTRGETQALVTATLGSTNDGQKIETVLGQTTEHFLLHYNFPPYCVGEVGAPRGVGRRELGHGNLARKALIPVVPNTTDFPYTIRVVSDIMESNGSSSMASICGGTMAMMDAGIPISNPVAGIAMGLIKEGSQYTILSDILGDEDHYGDLDFKVAGTQNGITALQMDIKIDGLTLEIMRDALAQAKVGRIHILKEMLKALSLPRNTIPDTAPRVTRIKIKADKIGKLIGPGGKTIREIQESNKCEVSIDDQGVVTISAMNQKDIENAISAVENIASEPIVGRTYHAKVKTIKDFGVFVEYIQGHEGLVHVTEFIENEMASIKNGSVIIVKLTGFDSHGRAKLVHKELVEKENIEG